MLQHVNMTVRQKPEVQAHTPSWIMYLGSGSVKAIFSISSSAGHGIISQWSHVEHIFQGGIGSGRHSDCNSPEVLSMAGTGFAICGVESFFC